MSSLLLSLFAADDYRAQLTLLRTLLLHSTTFPNSSPSPFNNFFTQNKDLTSLHLNRVYHALPPPDGFPALRRLSLSFGLPEKLDWSLLQPRNLPLVNTLILDPVDWSFVQDPCFRSSFIALVPQLQALLLSGSDQGDPPVDYIDLLNGATELKHLYLATKTSTAFESLSSLPSTLETLRLSRTAATASILLASLQTETLPAAFESLQQLTIPNYGPGWEEDFAREEVALIRSWCEKREVRFVEEGKDKVACEDWNPLPVERKELFVDAREEEENEEEVAVVVEQEEEERGRRM